MDKSILKQKRKIGFSLGLILISSQVIFTLMELLLEHLGIEESIVITYLFNAFSLYIVAFFLVKLLLRKVENVEPKPKKKLTLKKILIVFVKNIKNICINSLYMPIMML